MDSSMIKLKQENFRVKIRRENTENIFKEKRLIALQNNLPSSEHLNDRNDLIQQVPIDLVQNYANSNIQGLILNIENLSKLIRKFAHRAKMFQDNNDIVNYKSIEDVIESFFVKNQDVVGILLELCELKNVAHQEDQEGYLTFNKSSYLIKPDQYFLCEKSFLILTNITYFTNAAIITNLADREITSKVYKSVLQKLDQKQFMQNFDKCCQIMDNMLHFYGNLLIDPNLKEEQLKDMCFDLLCSKIGTNMKQMMVSATAEQKRNYQHIQIVFLRTVLGSHMPEELMQFQCNVIYFIQLAVFIISNNVSKDSTLAIVVLEKLSHKFEGIISVATKSIWEILMSKLMDPSVYFLILGLFGNLVTENGDNITLELIKIGFLDIMIDVLQFKNLSLNNLQQTLWIFGNMLITSSNELVDTFCQKILSLIIPSYALHLDQEEYIQDHALHLINIVRSLIKNKAMTIIDHVYVLESEILENLVMTQSLIQIQSIKTHPSLLIDFIEMIYLYKNLDSLLLIEILSRLQGCNSNGALNIAYNRLPPLQKNDKATYLMEEYADFIFYCEKLFEQKSSLDFSNQIDIQAEEIYME